MNTKLIQLEDGILVEVETLENESQQISWGVAERVEAAFSKIQPMLINVCNPISAAWKELSQDIQLDQAEVEVSLSFEGEGNIYITKSKAQANLTVKLILKPRQ